MLRSSVAWEGGGGEVYGGGKGRGGAVRWWGESCAVGGIPFFRNFRNLRLVAMMTVSDSATPNPTSTTTLLPLLLYFSSSPANTLVAVDQKHTPYVPEGVEESDSQHANVAVSLVASREMNCCDQMICPA